MQLNQIPLHKTICNLLRGSRAGGKKAGHFFDAVSCLKGCRFLHCQLWTKCFAKSKKRKKKQMCSALLWGGLKRGQTGSNREWHTGFRFCWGSRWAAIYFLHQELAVENSKLNITTLLLRNSQFLRETSHRWIISVRHLRGFRACFLLANKDPDTWFSHLPNSGPNTSWWWWCGEHCGNLRRCMKGVARGKEMPCRRNSIRIKHSGLDHPVSGTHP